jgi:hypothetical protein
MSRLLKSLGDLSGSFATKARSGAALFGQLTGKKLADLKTALAKKSNKVLDEFASRGMIEEDAISRAASKANAVDTAGGNANSVEDLEKSVGEIITGPVTDAGEKIKANLNAEPAPKDAVKPESSNKKVYITAVSLIAALAVSITTGFIVKGYMDRANLEKQQCIAEWETTYIDILKGPDGELIRIDTPQEWTDNMLHLESVIEARDDVNKDPEKAKKMLMQMYADLNKCISKDTTPLGSTLNGLSKDVGNALNNVMKPAVDAIVGPATKAIDSASNFGMIVVFIVIASVFVIAALVALKVVMGRNRRNLDMQDPLIQTNRSRFKVKGRRR